MRNGDLIAPQPGERFDRTTAAENVKGIDHDRTSGVPRVLEDIECGLDRVKLLAEAEEFHRGKRACGHADLEKFAVAMRAHRGIRSTFRWAGDDVARA